MKRLGLDYIDLYAAHGGQIADFTDEMLKTLDDLKSQGIIRAYGVNTFDTEVLEWINKNKAFDYVMCDYNIMRQDREDLIQRLNQNGIGVIGGAALAEGLYKRRKVRNIKDIWYVLRANHSFKNHMKVGKNFQFINNYKNATGNQIALRYVLDNPNLTSAVFNTTNPRHLKENVRASQIKMPDAVRKKIEVEGRKVNTSNMDR